MFKFNQNDLVDFDNGVIKGYGQIKGVAVCAEPVIGANYIIEDLSGQFPNETYPYSHLPMFEIHLKLSKPELTSTELKSFLSPVESK